MTRLEDSGQAIDLNAEPDSCVPCSICLDLVSCDGDRSTAKLQCGHEFHLDCIGSAFNVKGMMQCPNCRKIEKGRWLYASGPTNSSPELSTNDGGNDDYPFYFSFAEVPYRVHICPFRGLTQVHPSSEPSLGPLSTLTPMIAHQRPGSIPPPHGWIQFQHAPYHHIQQSPSLPMLTGAIAGRIDSARSMARFTPSARAYNPNPGFSLYAESPPVNYSHAWARDQIPHFPQP
uniref:RING-type domain-containing protein n=1 Tax=Opuntia streptacantha TaxID=393608 RepID=A0A7C9CFJ5_OPUST